MENILTDDQCQCINEVLASIAQTRELVLKCKDCGLDMDRHINELDAQQKFAEGIKRNFFPDRM